MNASVSLARLVTLAAGVWLAVASATVQAQQLPSAGELLQQVPRQPRQSPPSNLDLRMLRPTSARAPASIAFRVRSVKVTGNTLLPEAELQRIVSSAQGRKLTLGDLYQLAERVGDAFHQAGYPLTRAYVPAQTVRHGVVTIAVIEARYGKVELENHSQVATRVLDATLAPLKTGAPVADRELERTLLLLGDIPGARVSSAIKPGAQPGTSDLVANVTSAPRYTGTVGADDYGSAYTGRLRLGANVEVHGPLHLGDLLDLRAMSSGGGMNYLSGGYRFLLDGQGTTLRASGEYLNYRLSHGFLHRGGLQDLDAHGSVVGAGLTLTQPIIRSVASNLYGQLAYHHRALDDDIDVAAIHDRRNIDVGTLSLAGDERDHHGITNYRISGSYGNVDFTNALASLVDRAGAQTQGGFGTLRASLSRLQQLTAVDALYLGYTGQWASKNLDPSQQFFLGGPNTIPGYDVGTFGGSAGSIITAEYRRNFVVPATPGAWQVALFVDTGHLKVFEDTHGHPGDNHVRVYSGGIRMAWTGPRNWVASGAVGAAFGPRPQIYGDESRPVRLWLQLRRGFAF